MEYGAVVVWWLLFVGLAIAGRPIASLLLHRLEDDGAGLSLPLAIVSLTLPVYWLGHVTFGRLTAAFGVVVLLFLAVVSWRYASPTYDRRFIEVLGVFSIAFLLLVAVRAVDPSIQPAGGEKFLDFGLLNAVLRTDRLPPEDMWFAGSPVQYYYGGQLIAGMFSLLVGTPARYAYNLALAGFYGTLVATVYSLSGSIAAARGGPYRLAGLIGAVFVGFASNFVAPLQTVLWLFPRGIARGLADRVAAVTALDAGQLLVTDSLFYWTSSRVIPGTINEFPLFAFLNGDLHAHMISTPFLVTAAALAFAYYLAPEDATRERQALLFGTIPPLGGLIAVVNTWSFPTVIGLTWLTVILAPASPASILPHRVATWHSTRSGWEKELVRLAIGTTIALGVGILGLVWALPFVLGPATGASGRSLGLFPERSGLLAFVLVYGAFLVVFWLYLGSRTLEAVDERRSQAVVLVVILFLVGLSVDAPALAVVLPLITVAWLLLREHRAVGFETVLLVAGAGLVLLVEFFFVKEQAGPGRLNTVFKTYMQVWILWATAVGVAFANLLPSFPRLPAPSPERIDRALAYVGVVLLVSVSIYGVVALGLHFNHASAPTLDATRWAASTHSEEWEAIEWLDREAGVGQPNIVSAPGCWCNPVEETRPYRWVNAPSSFTGLPTLAGWSHEVGYRGEEPYNARVQTVRDIYTGSPEHRHELLVEHDVEYVYVGPNEQALYGPLDFAGEAGLSAAFKNEAVTIYRVDGV